MAGVTLGGGSGWLERTLGPSCDHLVAAEVVTADGRLLAADADEHPDLWWALRGGGGNFGVVTQLELCLHPVGPTALAGQLLHPRDRAAELLALVRDVMADAPDELGVGCALAATPDLPFLPEPVRGRPVVGVTLCWCGEVADGERAIGPLRTFGPPALDSVRPMPYVDAQRLLDPLVPPGRRYQVSGTYLRALPDAAIGVLVAQAGRAPSPGIDLVVAPQGGRLARPPATASAFDAHQRQAAYNTQILTGWDDPGDDEREAGWVAATRAALEPWSAGSGYLNFLGDEGPDRVRAAFSPATWTRLRQVKARYDPDNLFRHNHNIPPS